MIQFYKQPCCLEWCLCFCSLGASVHVQVCCRQLRRRSSNVSSLSSVCSLCQRCDLAFASAPTIIFLPSRWCSFSSSYLSCLLVGRIENTLTWSIVSFLAVELRLVGVPAWLHPAESSVREQRRPTLIVLLLGLRVEREIEFPILWLPVTCVWLLKHGYVNVLFNNYSP